MALEIHALCNKLPTQCVSLTEVAQRLERGQDMDGIVVSVGDLCCSPVWAAVVCADEELLAALLANNGPPACRAQVNLLDSNSACFPLHCAAKLGMFSSIGVLLAARADANARNDDLFNLGASGLRLLPECGGRTALHLLCAAGHERAPMLEACSRLIAANAHVQAKDHLGLTPRDLALSRGKRRVVELLQALGAESGPSSVTDADVRRLCQEREDLWRATDLKRRRGLRSQALARIISECPRIKPELYRPGYLASLVSHASTDAKQLGPGVFCVERFLPSQACEALLSELDVVSAWADANDFHVQRPNSMNRYGMVLNDLGFREAMHALMVQIVSPLVSKLGLLPPGAADMENHPQLNLLSQHSFVVRYQTGEDEDLKTHRDDADVTLNLCLGRRFGGADVYFHARPTTSLCTNCNEDAADDEYAYPHPEECPFCTVRHQHVPGTAVLHLGRHVHGVDRLRWGERVNLIIWCRQRPYPDEMQDSEEQTDHEGAVAGRALPKGHVHVD